MRRIRRSPDILAFGLLAAGAAWLLANGASGLGYHWQWYAMPKYLLRMEQGSLRPGLLLDGLGLTLEIAAASLALSLVLGLGTALLRLSRSWTGRTLARCYLELVRNTPLIIQLFFLYFVLSPFTGLGGFGTAVLALSLFEGAYASEIFRAGILSVPRGQWEAAHSLGLSTLSAYRAVVLPQALRRVLPALTGQGVSLIKDSALASTIAVYELTMQGQQIVADTFLSFEVWFTVAAIYLALTLSLSTLSGLLEQRLKAAH
jgi:polar amino acid transport system permease protein